jgi:hypothetical protein
MEIHIQIMQKSALEKSGYASLSIEMQPRLGLDVHWNFQKSWHIFYEYSSPCSNYSNVIPGVQD